MKKVNVKALPGQENRLATILRSRPMRFALAERAGNSELAPRRELGFSAGTIADHLGKPRSPAEDAAFFETRRVSEAIILEKVRPVLFIRDGVFETAALPEIEKTLKKVREAFVKPIGAVGRIELSDHDTYEWCGTGWRVEADLIVTNRHVALLFGQRHGTTFKYRLNQLGKRVRARIDFREEFKGVESEEYGIAEILWVAADNDTAPDLAVLRVRKDPGLPEPVPLARKKPEPRQQVAVVGYPAKDSRNDFSVMSDLFRDVYDVKRFSPGEIVLPAENSWYFTHDCTTLGGSSGSAVFDLGSREVVGLHFGGSFRKTNYAVTASVMRDVLARRSWVAVTQDTLKVAKEAFSEKKRTLSAMKDRAGYDPNFLGRRVSPPKPGKSHSVLKTGTPGDMLPYTHFSIMMSKSRRFPISAAENVDGALKIKLKRNDTWGFDPRIPKGTQVGHQEFYGPEAFDKGHMVRRENPGWGETEAEARLGEDDTFVYANAIAQMPQLNQREWFSLEEYVLDNASTQGFRICVFTGPVFRPDDPVYSDVQVPTDFWKAVVAIDAASGALLTSAYLLSQEGLMPKEGFRYGPFKTYQVPLRRIEELADVKFTKAVRDSDVFRQDEIEEMVSTARYVEITSADDVILTRSRK